VLGWNIDLQTIECGLVLLVEITTTDRIIGNGRAIAVRLVELSTFSGEILLLLA
jgi:hypothetical protein